ncbi:MAG: PadR family transcriptional regulator [Lentisphaerae bacterium]|nr:PadR family transcriptional regulator [Lentisphaerota bacterium]
MELNQCACSGKTLDRLLRPVVLAILARAGTHGYDLVQQLAKLEVFADSPPDTSGIYKTLKSMEKEGLVSSDWDCGKSGPAKRRFTLTQDGRTCLNRWAETLRTYRAQIDGLLGILDAS